MSSYIPVSLQRQIRKQFADCCAYCRTSESLTATTFEFEHIVPISAGGKTLLKNVCLACPTCNRHKASRQTATDPKTGEIVPLFHPQQQSWDDHFCWKNDWVEVISCTAVGRATCAALRMNRPQLVRVRRMWVILGEHPPQIN